MKKLTGVVSVLAGFTFVFTFGSCSDGGDFTAKSYSTSENVQAITVEATDREIEIGISEDDTVYIDYDENEKEYYDISLSENDELTIKLVLDKEWTDFIGTKPSEEFRKISLKVPDELLSDISVTTTNEAIKISAVSVSGNIVLNANGGDVKFERVAVGEGLDVKAKNGNITGTVIGSWEDFSISCTIKKGDCNLPAEKKEGGKLLKADCNNGNINIDFVSE